MPAPLRPTTALLTLALLFAGCATTAPPPAQPTPPPPPPPAAQPAASAPPQSEAVHWVRASAEHRAAFVQTFELAGEKLRELAEGRQPGTWAVIVDADETLIDNSLYQAERGGAGFSAESWTAWALRQEATALPGAQDFLETVRSLGGHIAVVTNRNQAECLATEDNLAAERLPYDVVLCMPMGGPSDKGPRWLAVQQGTASEALPPLEVLMYLGDSITDFPGGSQQLDAAVLDRFGDVYFMLPNPMYGSWQRLPPR
ncbi:MAG TPA: HAD family acid phosphatase [Thermoanaerobaculia bacterium]|nr:HAD family acid phosphatase [Thermoanaerobaculia bacterium]